MENEEQERHRTVVHYMQIHSSQGIHTRQGLSLVDNRSQEDRQVTKLSCVIRAGFALKVRSQGERPWQITCSQPSPAQNSSLMMPAREVGTKYSF